MDIYNWGVQTIFMGVWPGLDLMLWLCITASGELILDPGGIGVNIYRYWEVGDERDVMGGSRRAVLIFDEWMSPLSADGFALSVCEFLTLDLILL
jgi:hypothetical protein